MRKFRIYLDTSILNFLFAEDAPEKKEITSQFFESSIKVGFYQTFISRFVIDEIMNTTNEQKRTDLLRIISDYPIDFLNVDDSLNKIDELSEHYIFNQVVPASKKFDALHVEASSVFEIDFLVSWNFKHLANVNREAKFLSVNKSLNYNYPLRIVTPENLFNDEY